MMVPHHGPEQRTLAHAPLPTRRRRVQAMVMATEARRWTVEMLRPLVIGLESFFANALGA